MVTITQTLTMKPLGNEEVGESVIIWKSNQRQRFTRVTRVDSFHARQKGAMSPAAGAFKDKVII